MSVEAVAPELETLADLLHDLGEVPLERVRLRPPPGAATEADSVRIPDVAFTSWDRMPDQPIPGLVPDLAIEILGLSNTPGEMARKRREFFAAGVRLVWEVDLRRRTVHVFHAPEFPIELTASDTVTGEDVLPGFSLPLAELFAELDRHG